MDKFNLEAIDIVNIIKSSHSLSECSFKIYGENNKSLRNRITRYCNKKNISYNDLFLKKEERHNYCEFCGKEILGKHRFRKRFCSHSCAAHVVGKGRKHSEESKTKISHSLQRRNTDFDGTYKVSKKKKYSFDYDPKKKYYCLNCGTEIKNASASKSNKYCSLKCQHEHIRKEFIKKWKNGEVDGSTNNGFSTCDAVKHYLLEKNNYKCEKCGFSGVNPYTNNTILQIHHVDGDSSNNKEENLQVLCPNCHAMTDNYGSRNKNATKGRSKYFGKSKN